MKLHIFRDFSMCKHYLGTGGRDVTDAAVVLCLSRFRDINTLRTKAEIYKKYNLIGNN